MNLKGLHGLQKHVLRFYVKNILTVRVLAGFVHMIVLLAY